MPTASRIDPSVVRGLEYYTGPVYEAELLAEIPNEEGQIVRFGSVGGGGRYDGLVSRFRGEPVPATGFSIGVSRLMTALKNLGKLDTSDVLAPVVVLVMDKDTESLGRYQKMVAELRAGRHPRRNVSRRRRHEGADEICRPARQPVRRHPGRRRARRGRGADQGPDRRRAAGGGDRRQCRLARRPPGAGDGAGSELVAAVQKILDAQAAERGRGR